MATEEFKVSGQDVVETIKRIVSEGNARRILVKKESGEVIVEFPLAVGAVGALIVPMVAAIGVITALVTNCTIVVERRDTPKDGPKEEDTIEA